MNEIQKLRTPELIGSEIRSLTNQAKSVTLWFGIEIGRRLCEAKELVGHGNWLGYLESETEFSQSTANRFMTVFKEYGSAQSSLFGAESNYPALNNLSISNALRLLAVPAEEREEFAETNDVEHMSSRELDKLLKEKQEAEKRAKTAEDALEEATEGSALAMAELEEKLAAAREKASDAKERGDELKKRLAAAKEELEELKNRPVEVAVEVDTEAVEKAKAETATEYTKKIEKLEASLAAAKEKSKKLADKADKAAAELAAAEKKAQLANPETAVFKELFEQAQVSFNRLSGCLIKIKASDPTTAEKLSAAVNALVTKMQEAVNA